MHHHTPVKMELIDWKHLDPLCLIIAYSFIWKYQQVSNLK